MRIFSIIFGALGCVIGICFMYAFFHLSEYSGSSVVALFVECAMLTILSIMTEPNASEDTQAKGLMLMVLITVGVVITLFATSAL